MSETPRDGKVRLRAVVFDLGDTLVECTESLSTLLTRGADLLHERLSRQHPALSREAFLRQAQQAVGGRARALAGTHRALPARERVALALRALGVEPQPRLLDDLVAQLYAPVSACSRLLPQARDVLRRLKRAGLRLGLISNTPWDVPGELVERDLVRFGLREFFDVLVFSEIGFRKPHPEIFAQALAALGVRAEEAIMVGNSLADDAAGAHAVGMKTVWLSRSRRICRGTACRAPTPAAAITPDYVARDLRQAAQLILALAQDP